MVKEFHRIHPVTGSVTTVDLSEAMEAIKHLLHDLRTVLEKEREESGSQYLAGEPVADTVSRFLAGTYDIRSPWSAPKSNILHELPADSRPGSNDHSLWDHMRMTAAFAVILAAKEVASGSIKEDEYLASRWKLRLAGLLHDIGKPWGFTDERTARMSHPKKSAELFRKTFAGMIPDGTIDEVAGMIIHHQSSPHYQKLGPPSNLLEKLVNLADTLAAGTDRGEAEEEEDDVEARSKEKLAEKYGAMRERFAERLDLDCLNESGNRDYSLLMLDADIEHCFDEIPHDRLMEAVARRISDGYVLKLIRMWLRSPVLIDGTLCSVKKGTPQGGVISPLLANIYLHQLDVEWVKRGQTKRCGHNAHLVRYADDIVILSDKPIKGPAIVLGGILAELGLKLSERKTKIVRAEEGFDFLGFRFIRQYARKWGRRKSYYFPTPESVKRIKGVIGECLGRHMLHVPPEDVVKMLNCKLIGWWNYFQHSNAKGARATVQGFLLSRFRRFLRRRKNKSGIGRYRDLPNEVLTIDFGLAGLYTTVRYR